MTVVFLNVQFVEYRFRLQCARWVTNWIQLGLVDGLWFVQPDLLMFGAVSWPPRGLSLSGFGTWTSKLPP